MRGRSDPVGKGPGACQWEMFQRLEMGRGLRKVGREAIPSRGEGKGVEGEVVRTRMRRGWRIVGGGGVDIYLLLVGRGGWISGSSISRCRCELVMKCTVHHDLSGYHCCCYENRETTRFLLRHPGLACAAKRFLQWIHPRHP